MAVEFRCEHCGALLSADAEAGAEVLCPHCDNVAAVPAGLASLPHPQVPGDDAEVPDEAEAPEPADVEEDVPPAGDEPPPEVRTTDEAYPTDSEEFEEEEEEDEFEGEPGPLSRVMMKSTPWAISFVGTAGVMLALTFISILIRGDLFGQEIIVPDARLSQNPGGAISPADTKTSERTRSVRPTPTRKFSKKEAPAVDTGKTSDASELIGMAAGGASGGSPFGMSSGGGGGPASSFYGSGGNAHHIVYCIDRSGSMEAGGKFRLLRQQLLLSIAKLSPVQDFHVIMFSSARGEAPKEKAPTHLTLANDESRGQVAVFLDEIGPARGGTVASPAIVRAFGVLQNADPKRPGKLIYLLTDGEFSDKQDVFETLKEVNQRKEVLINTYLLSTDEPAGPRGTLKRIAKENGGRYKHVSPDEVY